MPSQLKGKKRHQQKGNRTKPEQVILYMEDKGTLIKKGGTLCQKEINK